MKEMMKILMWVELELKGLMGVFLILKIWLTLLVL